MQALILAGGKGTRLRPLTDHTPKPIVPVMNRPFLLFQIELLKLAGITDIILSLNYQPDKIEDLLGDGAKYGANLRYLVEPEPLGTGGAYGFARGHIERSTIVLNGDILTNVPLAEMIAQHTETKAEATIFLTPVEDPSAYGLVETDDNSRVKRFLEKPKPEEIDLLPTNLINAGIYILEPDMLEFVPEGKNCSFEYNVFPGLLKQEKAFYGFTGEGVYWRDIGNPQSYLHAHRDFLEGKIKGFSSLISNGGESRTAESSLLDTNCVIGNGVIIRNSVVGRGVHLGEKSVVENSVIWADTIVGNSVMLKNSFIGRGCRIGDKARIENEVLGDGKTVS